MSTFAESLLGRAKHRCGPQKLIGDPVPWRIVISQAKQGMSQCYIPSLHAVHSKALLILAKHNRRSTEAARANLLATEWARRAFINMLVSNVATSYFQLRAYDLQLEISRQALASRQESLQLTRTLSDGGAGTMLDVRQAEQLVATAAEEIPDLERRIQQRRTS